MSALFEHSDWSNAHNKSDTILSSRYGILFVLSMQMRLNPVYNCPCYLPNYPQFSFTTTGTYGEYALEEDPVASKLYT